MRQSPSRLKMLEIELMMLALDLNLINLNLKWWVQIEIHKKESPS